MVPVHRPHNKEARLQGQEEPRAHQLRYSAAYGMEANDRIISSANRMRIFDKSIDALGLPAGCQLLPLSAQPAPL